MIKVPKEAPGYLKTNFLGVTGLGLIMINSTWHRIFFDGLDMGKHSSGTFLSLNDLVEGIWWVD